MTHRRFGSLTTRCALVVMAQKLEENSAHKWKVEWDLKGMMKSGLYLAQFTMLLRTKVAAEKSAGTGKKHDTLQKAFKLKETSINPEHKWVANRNRFLNAIASNSRNVDLENLLEKGEYKKAKELKKKDGMGYQRQSLLEYICDNCNCQTYRPPRGKP
mmetsp:Transcript_14447/g.22286  ORF Transcript_14447/g.22286 Transcript_14447/m.22286 type:complete len:158 (-) Transcript_14447:1110-1583(-)